MFTEAAKDFFFELDADFIAKYMPLANKYQPKESRDETKINGKNIAVSCGRMAPEGRLVAIRTELAEKYGLGLVDDPDATLDEMLNKCYGAGLQKIYDEMYSQYNEWLKTR